MRFLEIATNVMNVMAVIIVITVMNVMNVMNVMAVIIVTASLVTTDALNKLTYIQINGYQKLSLAKKFHL